MGLPYISFTLRLFLAAPVPSFARQRTYGYASSQELGTGTHQKELHYLKGI